ncbi:MAG: GNAT family N-acetyltransferase [Candidatus Dadabacteria bacterium]|nr:MAG: GNAT family N-acetyltransferase [Candidatus Dadabacteria bacterium]
MIRVKQIAVDALEIKTLSDWRSLAAKSCSANPFYESWFMLPAMRRYKKADGPQMLFFYSNIPGLPEQPVAFIPLRRVRRFKGLPVRGVELWRDQHTYYCEPLCRAGFEQRVVEAFYGWLKTRGLSLMRWHNINPEGSFSFELVKYSRRMKLKSYNESFKRAAFLPAAHRGYPLDTLSAKRRRNIQSRRRQLEELGGLTVVTNIVPDRNWFNQFVAVEKRSWKGEAGTAILCDPVEYKILANTISEAKTSGALRSAAIYFDGRMIAGCLYFRVAKSCFYFKTAYDPRFKKYAPGIMLDIELLKSVSNDRELQFIDSCASPADARVNELWPDRRRIETLVTESKQLYGSLLLDTIAPVHKRIKNRFYRNPEYWRE